MYKKVMMSISFILSLSIVVIFLSSCEIELVEMNSIIYRPPTYAKTVYVIKSSSMTDAEYVMIQSLQGIVSQTEASILIEDLDKPEESKQTNEWIKNISNQYDINLIYTINPWNIVLKFKDYIKDNKYVLYESTKTSFDMFNNSINHAATISGVERYLIIEKEIEETAIEKGFILGKDARDYTLRMLFEEYKGKLSKSFLVHQNPNQKELRDYGISGKALSFYGDYETDLNVIEEILSWADKNAPVLGWTENEIDFVSLLSPMSKVVIPSDWSSNLSFYSSLPQNNIKQTNFSQTKIKGEKDKHYVAIVMSDGDNIQWYQRDFINNSKFFGSEHRGKFKMTWGISPSMYDLSPNIMSSIYNEASNMDQFIAGPGGFGYTNISDYDPDSLNSYAQITSNYMKKSDLNYVNFLDSSVDPKAIDSFAKQNQIAGGIWSVGNKYIEGGGAVYWSNGKPFITARETLWRISGNENSNKYYGYIERVAQRINNYKTDYSSIEGYTVVVAHSWSLGTMDNIFRFVNMLDDHVELITIGEMVEMVKENVPHNNVETLEDLKPEDFDNNLALIENEPLIWDEVKDLPATNEKIFTFNNSTNGFILGHGEQEYDKAEWQSSFGRIMLDGSDLDDTLDKMPNSWMYQKIKLSNDAEKLKLSVAPGERSNTNFRIRILYEENGVLIKDTLTDGFNEEVDQDGYHLLSKQKNLVFDISKYAGKTILLILEQDDNGEGEGEIVYVYWIAINEFDIFDKMSQFSAKEIFDYWEKSGQVEFHLEGVCLEVPGHRMDENNKEIISSIEAVITVPEYTTQFNFSMRMFLRGPDETKDNPPIIKITVNGNDIKSINGNSELTVTGDEYKTFSFDLSDYAGQKINIVIGTIYGEHAAINKIWFSL